MMSLVEEEYERFTRDRKWKQVFDKIQNEASVLYSATAKHARLPENRERNRYRDVSPYDDFRVLLEGCDNNYINASRVEVPLAKRCYILTQGPLSNTSGHFWLMIWQQNSRGILMLNKIIEDGRLKCHPYFPMGAEFGGEDSLTYDDVNIRVEYIKSEDYDYFVIRTLRLVHLETQEEKLVLQFHYVDWPDFGIPINSETFLSFLYAVRQSEVIPALSPSSSPDTPQCGPPVIHCSAGIGRSGTFILVDSALVLVERTRSLSSLDLRSMLIDMRKYRCGLIQRPEQLQFSYMAILDGAHAILSTPPPSPDQNGVEMDDDFSVDSDEDSNDSEQLSYNGDDINDEPESCLGGHPDTSSENTAGSNISKNASDDGPAPPVRTSSLSSDQDRHNPNTQEEDPPTEVKTNKDIPDPPKRTSSLHKSASLDEHPPPVPPRPPSTFDRQKSAPPIPETGSVSSTEVDVDGEEEKYGFENITPRPIGMCNNPIKRKREETLRKTRELVESMRAKQLAAEAIRNGPYDFPSRRLMIGAGIAIALAAGVMYCRGSML